jgi:hypothetical protein
MDYLIIQLVKMIIGLFSDKKEKKGANTMPPRPPPPNRPEDPVQYFAAPNSGFAPGKRQIQMHKFRRQPVPQPRRAAPVGAPPLPPRLPPKPAAPVAAPALAVPVKAPAPAISAISIRQLIRSRPTALRTIFALSEVLMPPVALRDENRLG